MTMTMRTETKTLILVCRILARDIRSDDGVANSALAEIADRMEELEKDRERRGASKTTVSEKEKRNKALRREPSPRYIRIA